MPDEDCAVGGGVDGKGGGGYGGGIGGGHGGGKERLGQGEEEEDGEKRVWSGGG